MNNIDIFKEISGLVFAHLYDNFPLKITISASEFSLKLGDEFWEHTLDPIEGTVNQSEWKRNRSPAAIAGPSIEWLASAGFLTYVENDNGIFRNVCLTAKGLEAIESDSERGNELLAAALDIGKDTVAAEAKERLRGLFSDMLSWSIEKYPTLINLISNTPEI